MNNELVSIIVPVYNVEKYLKRCIDSILKQRYQNLEIILIDDGATDQSGSICDEYKEKDNRIIVIHQKNGGLSAARNAGLDIASGSWIMFVDSDDWVSEDYVSHAVKTASEQQADVVLFDYILADDNGPYSTENLHPDYHEGYLAKPELMCGLADGRIPNYVCCKLFHRKFFRETRFPAGIVWEDMAMIYLMMDQADRIFYTEHPTYYYYQRRDSISARPTLKSKVDIYTHQRAQHRFFEEKYPEAVSCLEPEMVISALEVCLYYYLEGDESKKEIQQMAIQTIQNTRCMPTRFDWQHKIALRVARRSYGVFEVICKLLVRFQHLDVRNGSGIKKR